MMRGGRRQEAAAIWTDRDYTQGSKGVLIKSLIGTLTTCYDTARFRIATQCCGATVGRNETLAALRVCLKVTRASPSPTGTR